MKENQSYRALRMLKYEWKPGVAIDEDDVDPVTTRPSTSYDLIIPSPIDQNTNDHDSVTNQSDFVPHQGADTEGGTNEDALGDDNFE